MSKYTLLSCMAKKSKYKIKKIFKNKTSTKEKDKRVPASKPQAQARRKPATGAGESCWAWAVFRRQSRRDDVDQNSTGLGTGSNSPRMARLPEELGEGRMASGEAGRGSTTHSPRSLRKWEVTGGEFGAEKSGGGCCWREEMWARWSADEKEPAALATQPLASEHRSVLFLHPPHTLTSDRILFCTHGDILIVLKPWLEKI